MLLYSIIISACLFAAPLAQNGNYQFEYGSPEELKGVERIFVYTGSDMQLRRKIVKNIKKKLENIIVTDTPEAAQVHLVFSVDAQTFYAGSQGTSTADTRGTYDYDTGTYTGSTTTRTSSSSRYRTRVTGDGFVGMPVSSNRIRLLLSFETTQTIFSTFKPSTKFARAFVKAYRAANSEDD